MKKIATFLWFERDAEEAVRFYCSLFPDARITSDSPGEGITIPFEMAGMDFIALNGGPYPTGIGPISLFVRCADQAEVDRLWDAMVERGGEPMRCGWIKDAYGITWQIVPNRLGELLDDDDEEKSQRVMQAMLSMIKLDVPALERAYQGS